MDKNDHRSFVLIALSGSQETDAEMDVGEEEISFFLFFPLLTNSYMCVLVAQSCPTLCNTMNCSLPGSSVHGVPRQEY